MTKVYFRYAGHRIKKRRDLPHRAKLASIKREEKREQDETT